MFSVKQKPRGKTSVSLCKEDNVKGNMI